MNTDIIYTTDCLPGLKKHLPNNSIDLLTCDPQYGWGFMGKDWDWAVPSVEIWQQCFRVLKPGAFAFIMSGPRLDCLIENGVRIREAGFMIGFTPIFWAFASGFPKAQNIGKAVDKRLGAERKRKKRFVGNIKGAALHAKSDNRRSWEMVQDDNAITSAAKALNGSYGGFQPKPAIEVVIVAQKPMTEKTYVAQALLWYKERQGILRGLAIQLEKRYNIGKVKWEE